MALSEAIDSPLRDELARSMWNGRTPYFDEDGSEYLLQFKPSEIEVTLNIDFSVTGEAEAGIKWWRVNASAKGSATSSATQTIKLSTLNPVRVDARPVRQPKPHRRTRKPTMTQPNITDRGGGREYDRRSWRHHPTVGAGDVHRVHPRG